MKNKQLFDALENFNKSAKILNQKEIHFDVDVDTSEYYEIRKWTDLLQHLWEDWTDEAIQAIIKADYKLVAENEYRAIAHVISKIPGLKDEDISISIVITQDK